ncbi:class I SAM-dependent methyltransferase [Actinoplanes sp. NPDC051494]|uniref:class I SAM-dependent methyltransferase n=1 Tax=Actinoplanes sp. NPDC051494 TaxID=3363907 RepID=UPI0037AD161D
MSDLLRRWDAQQNVYIEHREPVFDVMFDVLEQVCPGPELTVLDLACGPGAISRRFLHRFPAGRVVALDVDPVLLAIGQDALGDRGGRLRWVRADLRDPSWPGQVGTTVDAVLSSTALHWLSPPDLSAAYKAAADLLRPGGVLINADHLPLPAGSRLRTACEAIDAGRQQAAVAAGAEPWDAWWAAVEAQPELAGAVAERRTLWPAGSRDWNGAGLDFHRAALTAAGFTEVDVVWQDLEERVLAAVR